MDFAKWPCGNGQEGRPLVCPGRCLSLWKYISFKERKLTFRQKMLSLSADGAQQELTGKLKLLFVKRKTVVPLSRWGSLNHLNNLLLCAALYRCYKHTQLFFKSSPPPREPAKDNYKLQCCDNIDQLPHPQQWGLWSTVSYSQCFFVKLHFSFVSVVRIFRNQEVLCFSCMRTATSLPLWMKGIFVKHLGVVCFDYVYIPCLTKWSMRWTSRYYRYRNHKEWS